MADKGKKPSHNRGRIRSSRSKSKAATRPAPSETGNELASKRFVSDLMIRGEAAKPTKKGKLPLHATHVIKKQHEDGTVEVERVRYKTF